jgi:hypothetical protein
MKNIILFTVLLFGQNSLFAQTKKENTSFTIAEFRGGYGVNLFGNGLKEKYNAGNFSSSGGGLASLAAYHKFKKINYLNFGIKYKSLGASPAQGDNGEELFFNYWGAAITAKYFPFDRDAKKGIYLQGDFFFVSQFTQKYRKTTNKEFNHQFAIGNGLVFGLGYDFPIGNGQTMLTIGLEYETNSRTGEVAGIGDKNFKSSNFGIMTGIKF